MGKKKDGLIDYSRLEQGVFDLLEPICAGKNTELVDVEYVKEGENWYLRIFIDRMPPVDLDCCQTVSEAVEPVLDQKDPIPHSYILEVSSPGIERPLRKKSDYIHFAGKQIFVKLFSPIDSQKQFEGILLGLEDDQILMQINGDRMKIPLDKVAKVNLHS